jgi:hypothetical protein
MPSIYRTDIPCECGEYDLEITSGHVGYIGDMPCSEDYGKCPKCGKEVWNQKINERFKEQDI